MFRKKTSVRFVRLCELIFARKSGLFARQSHSCRTRRTAKSRLFCGRRSRTTSGRLCCIRTAPGKTARLMVGFLILKQLENLNDELVIEAWFENPYFQSFAPSAPSPATLPRIYSLAIFLSGIATEAIFPAV